MCVLLHFYIRITLGVMTKLMNFDTYVAVAVAVAVCVCVCVCVCVSTSISVSE